MHKVIEANAVLEDVVDTAHDAEDTEGEDPNTDDGNNGGVRVLEPAPDGEAGGNNINDENSTAELPRGDRGPEGTVGTSDEDEPVLSKRDLEEDDFVHVTEVLDDTAVLTLSVHGGDSDPGTDGKDDTEEDRHTPELGKVPLDGGLRVGGVVVGNG